MRWASVVARIKGSEFSLNPFARQSFLAAIGLRNGAVCRKSYDGSLLEANRSVGHTHTHKVDMIHARQAGAATCVRKWCDRRRAVWGVGRSLCYDERRKEAILIILSDTHRQQSNGFSFMCEKHILSFARTKHIYVRPSRLTCPLPLRI